MSGALVRPRDTTVRNRTAAELRESWARNLVLLRRMIVRRAELGLTVVYLLRRAIAVARRAGDFGACLELRAMLAELGHGGNGHLMAHREVADRDQHRAPLQPAVTGANRVAAPTTSGGRDASR